ncbi:MAG: S8 family serine peptidase [Myxococcota bacterium]|nr:S8 family serine peptidase [Myxococcota bacterium]
MRRSIAAAALLLFLAGCGSSSSGGDRGSASNDDGSITLAGRIQVAFGTAADGDVNEPNSPFSPNDTPANAQSIPNPVTLGGYVNQPGQGSTGRSLFVGDVRDLFRVELAEGETVRLFPASDVADLDLALLNTSGAEILRADSDSGFESLSVPASGEFLIEVSAFSGASNYVLTVGQDTGMAATAAEPTEFVPGEVLVRFRDPVVGQRGAASAAVRAQSVGLQALGQGARGEVLLGCSDEEEAETAFRALGVEHLMRTLEGLDRPERLRAATRRLAKALRRRADVVSADPNYVRKPTAVPSDDLYPLQWHYPMIGLPQAWDNVAPNSGVVVAVIDTGVVPSHPDLAGQLVSGYDFVSNIATSGDGNGCDSDPTDPGDGLSVGTSSWHGTHVTGTIVARTSLQPAGNDDGVAGVAWNARVMPLRALARGGGTDFDLIQAIYYAAGLTNGCNVLPAQRADVINMSLGGSAPSAALESALGVAQAAGVVLVAAAGNQATDQPFYPAAYDSVISVAAVDASRRLAPYSNWGSTIDVAAPGGDFGADLAGDGFADGVLSTLYDPGTPSDPFVYAFSEGTSMAAPHVAGVVALMLGVNDTLTPGDIHMLLDQGSLTEVVGSSIFYGNGLIDAFAAVRTAYEVDGGEPPVDAPRLRASPPALNFGSIGTATDVELTNAGGDDRVLTVQSYEVETTDGAPWLSVAPISVDGEGLGRYRVTVNRGLVTPGIYAGTVRFLSSENDVEVAVLMQSGTFAAGSPDAGRHFVLLLDPDTLDTMRSMELNASGGVYSFQFNDVAPGDYLLVAGSDIDNDLTICDAGEACGAFQTLDQPERITVDSSRLTLDFGTGFGVRLTGAASTSGSDGGYRRAIKRRLFF